jgi:AraC-like DNA-binding protein
MENFDRHEPTFRLGPLVHLPTTIRSLGHEPRPLFAAAGFDVEDFRDPDHRARYVPVSRLLQRCVDATGCEHLGLLVGQHAGPSYLGLAGFLARCSSTVGRALEVLGQNLDLHEDGSQLLLEQGPRYASLVFTLQVPGLAAVPVIYDLALTMCCQVMRTLCGADWNPATVHLERGAPDDRSPYQDYFRATVYFDSSECRLTFPTECLSLQPVTADALLFQHLEEEARALHRLQRQDLVEALPAALRRGILSDRCSAADIAGLFNIHERTLHRRLRASGTQFRRELDRTRRAVSEELLGGTRLPISEVADALGYADASGFIRAFQRWSGTTPAAWRRRNGRVPSRP